MTDVQEVTAVVDSNGVELVAGDQVYVNLELTRVPFWETDREARPFDFGEVDSVNDDGTVNVFWEAAGCSCTSENGRAETSTDLTKYDPESALREVAERSFVSGYKQGVSDNQQDIKEALGLTGIVPAKDN
jgi:hypothetical protein